MVPRRIPVENVYYLLCYAWRRLEGLDLVRAGHTSGEHAETLLTSVLCAATERALLQGLQRDYLGSCEELRSPRGKFDLISSYSRSGMLQQGVVCEVSDLRTDTALNRLVKATLTRCTTVEAIDESVRRRAWRLLPRFAAVTLVRFDDKLVRQLSVHRHVAHYRLLVELCLLLWRHAFPTEQGATTRFAQFIADEQAMGLLFEQFIRGFLDVECPDVRLPSRNLEWCCSGSSEARKWLPRMEMDIPVQLGSQRLVLECKFYRNPWAEQRGRRTLHSAHLQQLYSYLENDHRQGGIRAHGVLLYAAAGDETRLDFELCGFPVSVRTLDLAQQWPRVDAAVRRLVAEWRAPTSTGQVFTSTG